MKLLPRSFEYRFGDTFDSVAVRLAIWTRDAIKSFSAIPDVSYTTVTVPSGGELDVTSTGTPRSVVVARVVAGAVSAAPGIEWVPIAGGFTITAVHGVAGAATLSLRVEV
jgi:hypothetical protein